MNSPSPPAAAGERICTARRRTAVATERGGYADAPRGVTNTRVHVRRYVPALARDTEARAKPACEIERNGPSATATDRLSVDGQNGHDELGRGGHEYFGRV